MLHAAKLAVLLEALRSLGVLATNRVRDLQKPGRKVTPRQEDVRGRVVGSNTGASVEAYLNNHLVMDFYIEHVTHVQCIVFSRMYLADATKI